MVSYQNESCLACTHPPPSYEGRGEQEGSSHFDEKLILFGHYGRLFLNETLSFEQDATVFISGQHFQI